MVIPFDVWKYEVIFFIDSDSDSVFVLLRLNSIGRMNVFKISLTAAHPYIMPSTFDTNVSHAPTVYKLNAIYI